MTQSQRMAPPLSPVLLAGVALRPLPPLLLQPALDAAMTALHRRHPDIFDRLAGLGDPEYLIDPTDLPYVFLLRPDPEAPRLSVLREEDAADAGASATIRGPLLVLIDLLEGRIDGDAQFFSRDLVIEGDTEAVVALRNAVDGADVDVVGDILSLLGPFAGPARRATGLAGALFKRASRDMEMLRDAVISPALREGRAQAAKLNRLEEKFGALSRSRRPGGPSKA